MTIEGNIVLDSGEVGVRMHTCPGGEVRSGNYVRGSSRLYHSVYHPPGFKLGETSRVDYCADECSVPALQL